MHRLVITSNALSRSLALALFWAAGVVAAATEPGRPQSLFIELPQKPEAPELNVEDTEGRRHSLADYQGRLLLVNFWAVWCGPCREEFPSMDHARAALREHGVEIVAVNSGDRPEAVDDFLAKYPVAFAVLLDKDTRITGEWQVQGLPTTYVVTPDGRIFGGAIGERAWDSPRMLAALTRLAERTGAAPPSD